MNAYEICTVIPSVCSDCALSGGDYTKDLQTKITGTGVELMGARQSHDHRCTCGWHSSASILYSPIWTTWKASVKEVEMIKMMGFDGKSIVNPRQIAIAHEVFTPTEKEIIFAEKVVQESR